MKPNTQHTHMYWAGWGALCHIWKKKYTKKEKEKNKIDTLVLNSCRHPYIQYTYHIFWHKHWKFKRQPKKLWVYISWEPITEFIECVFEKFSFSSFSNIIFFSFISFFFIFIQYLILEYDYGFACNFIVVCEKCFFYMHMSFDDIQRIAWMDRKNSMNIHTSMHTDNVIKPFFFSFFFLKI